MKFAYKDGVLKPKTMLLIDQINTIVDNYRRQGYLLSVRQIYYQLVSDNVVSNTEQSYKRVASVINDGRVMGHIDWSAIEDRNRDIDMQTRWLSGRQILDASARGYHMDMWEGQENRALLIVEKAALSGILSGVCRTFDVPMLAARGYPSVSIVRDMAEDHIIPALVAGQHVTVLHLGDHDPSGLDMTRDLEDRFDMFIEGVGQDSHAFTLKRIALSMGQVDELSPPPNPAKTTDSRYLDYRRRYGEESWELDALPPVYINNLVRGEVTALIDDAVWSERAAHVEDVKARLTKLAKNWKE